MTEKEYFFSSTDEFGWIRRNGDDQNEMYELQEQNSNLREMKSSLEAARNTLLDEYLKNSTNQNAPQAIHSHMEESRTNFLDYDKKMEFSWGIKEWGSVKKQSTDLYDRFVNPETSFMDILNRKYSSSSYSENLEDDDMIE